MWFDDQFENFRRLSSHFFNWDDIFENKSEDKVLTYGPYYYGYQMTVGPDGKPHIREWGNIRPTNALPDSSVREPFVDQIYDKDQKLLKFVAEMPGIEKKDIEVTIEGRKINIKAEHAKRKYETTVPLKNKVDENSANATYANGILQVTFKTLEEKPKGRTVKIQEFKGDEM